MRVQICSDAMYDKTFNEDCGHVYKLIYALGSRARTIIEKCVADHGGSVEFEEDDDPAWISEEAYATGLHMDGNRNVQITASDGDTYNLDQLAPYDTLDLASMLNRKV